MTATLDEMTRASRWRLRPNSRPRAELGQAEKISERRPIELKDWVPQQDRPGEQEAELFHQPRTLVGVAYLVPRHRGRRRRPGDEYRRFAETVGAAHVHLGAPGVRDLRPRLKTRRPSPGAPCSATPQLRSSLAVKPARHRLRRATRDRRRRRSGRHHRRCPQPRPPRAPFSARSLPPWSPNATPPLGPGCSLAPLAAGTHRACSTGRPPLASRATHFGSTIHPWLH